MNNPEQLLTHLASELALIESSESLDEAQTIARTLQDRIDRALLELHRSQK